MTIPAWAWITWLASTGGSFAILETLAIIGKGTLSSTLQRWLGIHPPKPWRRTSIPIFAGALITFVTLFIPHITG